MSFARSTDIHHLLDLVITDNNFIHEIDAYIHWESVIMWSRQVFKVVVSVFRQGCASCLLAAPLEMCGSSISATRPVRVVDDAYTYPYPTHTYFHPRLHWDWWLPQSHIKKKP